MKRIKYHDKMPQMLREDLFGSAKLWQENEEKIIKALKEDTGTREELMQLISDLYSLLEAIAEDTPL